MNNPMKNAHLESLLLEMTGASSVLHLEEIQSLWSGYGSISRYALEGCAIKQMVVKYVQWSNQPSHPRGWNTSISHQRKIKSYHVESAWYKQYSQLAQSEMKMPQCLGVRDIEAGCLILLEDLDAAGFPVRKSSANFKEMSQCIKWLAHFHGKFLETPPEGLWATGTYWHLETRPDELKAMKDQALSAAAQAIDEKLSGCPYQTLVHGDAKLANFCFSKTTDQFQLLIFNMWVVVLV